MWDITIVDIVRFEPKWALTALKRVYLIKRSLYIYSTRNFLPYPMGSQGLDLISFGFKADNIYTVGSV